MMKRIALAVMIVALGTGLCFAASPEKKAKSAANNWLELIDNKDYAQSYDKAASFFKANINKSDWVQSCGSLRDMLGKAEYRKLVSISRESRMEGAPDGEYVILVYETDFKKKANAQEIVVPMLDKDGKWRISGYHVD
ncbi:MAG TPA: DUF4019 domain-containing protein [Candidatus Omnitrophota bacterium]|nr:DUF4019 domain-containing protein [Candidatus Omnitrophota bacterium]HRZ67458.1 DUF4019 domain-containing protein [Candidatus Omnitrophota bacterium]